MPMPEKCYIEALLPLVIGEARKWRVIDRRDAIDFKWSVEPIVVASADTRNCRRPSLTIRSLRSLSLSLSSLAATSWPRLHLHSAGIQLGREGETLAGVQGITHRLTGPPQAHRPRHVSLLPSLHQRALKRIHTHSSAKSGNYSNNSIDMTAGCLLALLLFSAPADDLLAGESSPPSVTDERRERQRQVKRRNI